MKRIICICLLLSVLLITCGCGAVKENQQNMVAYYYRTTETDYGVATGLITAEIRETKGYTENYTYLIEQYLNGPKSYNCISPFPAGTTLEEFNMDSNTAQLLLSPHIATLSGVELTFACACMTRTVIELTGVHTVQIRTTNGTLNGSDSITMTADSYILWNAD